MSETLLAGLRILIVEDDYLIAIDLAAALEGLGAEIAGMAGFIEQALSLIKAPDAKIDGAVLDVNLCGERIYPVADELMARNISFVFATGYDRWIVPDAYAHIPRFEKPVSYERLAQKLADEIGLVKKLVQAGHK